MSDSQEYFKVRVSGQIQVALPLTHVETVLQLDQQSICPIPGVSPALLGVVNRRGNLTWVVDLSQVLELEPLALEPGKNLTAIVITRSRFEPTVAAESQRSVACTIEALDGVFTARKVKPMRKPLKSRLRSLLLQVAYQEKSGIAILDPTALLRILQREE
jgi:chemotaxis signal transduction protein